MALEEAAAGRGGGRHPAGVGPRRLRRRSRGRVRVRVIGAALFRSKVRAPRLPNEEVPPPARASARLGASASVRQKNSDSRTRQCHRRTGSGARFDGLVIVVSVRKPGGSEGHNIICDAPAPDERPISRQSHFTPRIRSPGPPYRNHKLPSQRRHRGLPPRIALLIAPADRLIALAACPKFSPSRPWGFRVPLRGPNAFSSRPFSLG